MDKTRAQVTRIAAATAKAIGLERELGDDDIVLVDGYSAGIYGIPDATTIDAMRTCARLEGMLTDPVYEGKSMAGLIGLVGSSEIPAGSKVLYAHLGGQPCLSAYAGVV
jgi:1-aminocyclopropane-1-carboxylate deaminase